MGDFYIFISVIFITLSIGLIYFRLHMRSIDENYRRAARDLKEMRNSNPKGFRTIAKMGHETFKDKKEI